MDSRDPLFGQSDSPPALPVTVPVSGTPPASAVPARPPQPRCRSAEELHVAEQPRQPLCELQPLGGPGAPMVSVCTWGWGCLHRWGSSLKNSLTWWFVVATADSDFSNKVELFSGTVHAPVALLQVGKSCLQPLLILLNHDWCLLLVPSLDAVVW